MGARRRSAGGAGRRQERRPRRSGAQPGLEPVKRVVTQLARQNTCASRLLARRVSCWPRRCRFDGSSDGNDGTRRRVLAAPGRAAHNVLPDPTDQKVAGSNPAECTQVEGPVSSTDVAFDINW